MTYPITPNPAIHNPSTSQTQQKALTTQQLQGMGDQMIQGIVNAVLYFITGGIVGSQAGSNSSTATTSLQKWFAQITGNAQTSLAQLSQLIKGVEGQTMQDVVTWWQGVEASATDASTQLDDFLKTGNWSNLTAAITDIVQIFFGTSTSAPLVWTVPSTSVTTHTQSIQPSGDFPNAGTLSGGGGWVWDGTTSNGSGASAMATANGTTLGLRGIVAAVQPGQVITPAAMVQWSGLTYSGSNPVQLQLIPWSGTLTPGTPGTPVVIAQLTSPASSGTWTSLTGTYTVPGSGVGFVQMRLVVDSTATAGSVWFTNCSADVTGGFLADLDADIIDIIASFAPGGTATQFQTGVTNLLQLFGLTSSTVLTSTSANTIWTNAINSIINPLNAIEAQADNVIVGVGNDLTNFFDWITGTTTPTSSTQVQAAAVTSTLGGGSTSLGTDVSFVQSAATGLAATVAQVQSNVNSLQNASDAVVGGVQIVDDGPGTNATGAGWGSDWTLNSGSNANLNLGFQCLGGTAIGSYTGQSLNTDNMVAGIIFNSLPQYNWLGDPADGASHRIKIRESSDRSSCVFADIWHDKVQLGYRKANVDTYWGSAVSITPAAGSNWEIYGGDMAGATPYLFQLVQNGVTMSPIATFTDSSHVSNMGSSYRGSGQDMYSDGSFNPGKTKFHARDLIQPLLKTMMAQHRNTSATASSLSGGAIYKLPVGWFNSQVYLMPGVTMDATNAGYIVADEGLYEFSFGIGLTSGVTGTPYIIAPVIWVNSAPYIEGNSTYAHDSVVGGYSVQITMSVYLFAGDTIYPALDARANQWSVAGESSGTLSWMQLAKVG